MTTSDKRPEGLAGRRPMRPGTMLKGKWNGNVYRLERLLGVGANGQVYLAFRGRLLCAVKLGMDAADLQGEANVLASLDRRERRRQPFLLDVDDARLDGRDVPFYAMQYVPGVPLGQYVRRRGARVIGAVGARLLERLAELHENGWVFGDLKCDNVLVTWSGQVALVDYGGMTPIGRSVRQFTEIYDRGYWHAGHRTADPAYDWFSAAVLWIHALDGNRLMRLTRTLLPQNRHPGELLRLVRTHPQLRPMESWMRLALEGAFPDTREASRLWRESLQRAAYRSPDTDGGVPAWMGGLLAASLVLCGTAVAVWLLH